MIHSGPTGNTAVSAQARGHGEILDRNLRYRIHEKLGVAPAMDHGPGLDGWGPTRLDGSIH